MQKKSPDILFIQSPWATTTRPSIALGILSQICHNHFIACQTIYPNLDLADNLGFEIYDRFSYERILYGLSEHLFAIDLFGKEALKGDQGIDLYWEGLKSSDFSEAKSEPLDKLRDKEFLIQLRDSVIPAFLDNLAARIMETGAAVIGLSATNNQVMSSLAIARRVKELKPDIITLFGGANFHGPMGLEYHRSLPHIIDHIFVGEAEESLSQYLTQLRSGSTCSGIPGVTYLSNGQVELVPGQPLLNLSLSPQPDYDDFFLEAERIRQKSGKVFNIDYLPFESSRGCWWGEKSHCVFCGNNEEQIHYRSKEVNQIVEDMINLSAKYKVEKLAATDWILSQRDCDELCNRLIDLDFDLDIFYEVRATLKKQQIKSMKKAGINKVQPGIESLSSPVLKLMKKGTTAIRHVQFLRWCQEFDVTTDYNILAGFPGEKAEWYLEMAKLFPKLYHLHPPLFDLQFVELHRFAPLYEQSKDFGLQSIRVRADYALTFPPEDLDPEKVGYFFQYESARLAPREEYLAVVQDALKNWLTAYEKSPLYEYKICPGYLRIMDNRTENKRSLCLSNLYQDVVLLCDEVQTRQSLTKDLASCYRQEVADGTLEKVIEELVAAEILMAEENNLLTLPIGHNPRTTEELRSYVFSS